jgi:hypothetical protein
VKQIESRKSGRKRRWIYFVILLFLFLLLITILLLFSGHWGLSFDIFSNGSHSNAPEGTSVSPTPQGFSYLKLDLCDPSSLTMIRDSISDNSHDNGAPQPSDGTPVSLSLPPFHAQSSGELSITAYLEVSGTSLSLSTPYTAICINVSNPSMNDPYSTSISMTSSWIAIDASGLGKGWHVNISATDFLDKSGNRIPVEACVIEFTDDDIMLIYGNQKPSSTIPSGVPLSHLDLKIASALPGQGMGSYLLEPTFTLAIPPDTPQGIYSSTISLTIFAGP